MRRSSRLLSVTIVGVAMAGLAVCLPRPAPAQMIRRTGPPPKPLSRTDPVAFTADEVSYDRDKGVVTATGNVEAWQNDHVLRADQITFDRNTNVAAATGHVTIIEPDGQVLFSDYAELTEGMRDGVLKQMRAILAENGKLVANGARRTDGKVNELSRAIYSTCNLCAEDPTKSPLWQIRARSAVQDGENHRIEYRDAVLDIYGIPVGWLPYFWHVDPSVKRGSGFLIPSYGHSKNIGEFVQTPYFWAIDEQSDATITPTFNTRQYLNLDSLYRRRFNDGRLNVDLGLGYDNGKPQAAIFANGRFTLDETWRYGFDLNRASSAVYLRDYKFNNHADILSSSVYLEGFGPGAYTKIDTQAYQGLVSSINQSRLPYALPRYTYSYFGEPDALGGRVSFDTTDFNVLRGVGTNTQRLGSTIKWDRPFQNDIGQQYKFTVRTDLAAYNATSLDQNPNYSPNASASDVRAQPNMALEVRWPFLRAGDEGGHQIIEPIVQAVVGPYTGGLRRRNIPNEDSLDFEFTDQNLFAINKYPGIDREEGGGRINAGLHLNWTSSAGLAVDQLVGQSYRSKANDNFPQGSGLEHRTSDVVTRTTITPASWFDITGRTRLDRRDLSLRFADVLGTTGTDHFRIGAGYLYSENNPYFYYDTAAIPASYYLPRNEITLNASGHFGQYRFSAFARRDLALNKMVSAGVRGTYENECLILDANLSRRYTSLNGDNGATLVLFTVTFKTVGQFGFHAF